MCSCIAELGGEDGAGVMVSGLDLDVRKHGLHGNEEVGFVNFCLTGLSRHLRRCTTATPAV